MTEIYLTLICAHYLDAIYSDRSGHNTSGLEASTKGRRHNPLNPKCVETLRLHRRQLPVDDGRIVRALFAVRPMAPPIVGGHQGKLIFHR